MVDLEGILTAAVFNRDAWISPANHTNRRNILNSGAEMQIGFAI